MFFAIGRPPYNLLSFIDFLAQVWETMWRCLLLTQPTRWGGTDRWGHKRPRLGVVGGARMCLGLVPGNACSYKKRGVQESRRAV